MRRALSLLLLAALALTCVIAGATTAAAVPASGGLPADVAAVAADWLPASVGSGSTAPVFSAVAMQDARVGLVVGTVLPDDAGDPRPSICRTTDGGATWTQILDEQGMSGELAGVAFSDPLHAWVVGAAIGEASVGGLLLTSADTGLSGRPVALPGAAPLAAVQFPTAAVGYLAGDGGTVWKTTDGGLTWTRTVIGAADVELTSMSFVDAPNGWVCGRLGEEAPDAGRCYATPDGGATWTDVTPDRRQALISCSFVSGREGWVLGADGDIFHTTDGGVSWGRQSTPLGPGAGLLKLQFGDAQNGWAVGWGSAPDYGEQLWGVVLHTTDGGRTWVQQDCGVQPGLRAVWAQDARTAWLAGAGGVVLRTTDGGGAGFVRTVRPVTRARGPVTVRRGGRATFGFTVVDPGVPLAAAVVVIADARGHVVKRVDAGLGAVGAPRPCTARIVLPRGRYTWTVLCTDYAGWTQARAGASTLIVR